jgi:hypothetical protein
MDNIENTIPARPESGFSELQEECDSLRHLLVSVLVLAIVVSGTLATFLYVQVHEGRAVLAQGGAQVKAHADEYAKRRPVYEEIQRRLTEYGKSHADFAPIMNKYGLNQPAVAPAKTGSPVPPPSTPPPATNKK